MSRFEIEKLRARRKRMDRAAEVALTVLGAVFGFALGSAFWAAIAAAVVWFLVQLDVLAAPGIEAWKYLVIGVVIAMVRLVSAGGEA